MILEAVSYFLSFSDCRNLKLNFSPKFIHFSSLAVNCRKETVFNKLNDKYFVAIGTDVKKHARKCVNLCLHPLKVDKA